MVDRTQSATSSSVECNLVVEMESWSGMRQRMTAYVYGECSSCRLVMSNSSSTHALAHVLFLFHYFIGAFSSACINPSKSFKKWSDSDESVLETL